MRFIIVETERDRVVLVFPHRGRDLLLEPDQAERLAVEIRRIANFCEAWITAGGLPKLLAGGSRGATVKSWDGKVNVRFDTPTDRESIPYQHARQLADMIESKVSEARATMTINWHHARSH